MILLYLTSINKLYEKLVHKTQVSVYHANRLKDTESLKTDNTVSVHHRNIQVLATNELYKIVNGLSPDIMKKVFPFNENTTFDTRSKRKFHSRATKSFTFGFESQSHLASKTWELVLIKIKNVGAVASCHLCWTCAFQVGFVHYILHATNLIYIFFFFFCFYHNFFKNNSINK